MRLPQISVVIPTLGREVELDLCQRSLADAHVDIEWIILRDRGSLAYLRNLGWRRAHAPMVLFVDDDIVAAPGYLRRVLWQLDQPGRVGVTGPSPIPRPFRRNRNLYKYWYVRFLYDFFMVAHERRPGHLTPSGTFVPDPDWFYQGPVEFLEACHMAFRKEALEAVGGFDEAYGGVGDWSEPDLCFRLRQSFGSNCLQFDPRLSVEHRCSTRGAYVFRRSETRQRFENYLLFRRRWVRPSLRNSLYVAFLWAYYQQWQRWLLTGRS